MSETITYQVDGDGIATLTIDLKDRPMNVITRDPRRQSANADSGLTPSRKRPFLTA